MNSLIKKNRSEHGSDFFWPLKSNIENSWWPKNARYYGSGRDALRSIIKFGKDKYNWQRLWLPSFLCQEVVSALVSLRLTILIYPDAPIEDTPTLVSDEIQNGDVILIVNYFGLRDYLKLNDSIKDKTIVIEDHTHDPWSTWAKTSKADYCIASLRKTLPIPDGAILWSPVNSYIPEQIHTTKTRDSAAMTKLCGMVLKGLYLEGLEVKKTEFRELLIKGEAKIASGCISGMSTFSRHIIQTFPVAHWRMQRLENWKIFYEVFHESQWAKLLIPSSNEAIPFSCILVFNSQAHCERVRLSLIQKRVYPAVLWPIHDVRLSGIPKTHIMLGKRLLSLSCDMRYSVNDMYNLANFVIDTGKEHL